MEQGRGGAMVAVTAISQCWVSEECKVLVQGHEQLLHLSRCVATHSICLRAKQDVSACQIYGACSPSILRPLKVGAPLPKDVPAGMLRGKRLPRENDSEEEKECCYRKWQEAHPS